MKANSIRIDNISDIETAFALHQGGNYDQARAAYLKLIDQNPYDYNALQLLGVLELNDGDFQFVADLISKALTIVDSDPSAYNNLGEAYRGLDRFTDAERSFRMALQLDSSYAIAHNNLAVVLKHLNRPHEAEEACRNALYYSPYYAEAFNNLGIILVHLNRLDEAETAYRQALAIKSDYVEPYINIGILFKNIGRYKESEQAYKKALHLNPKSDDAVYNLSILELLKGELRKGFEHYEKRAEKRHNQFKTPIDCRPWQGEQLNGKSLLIITEQGAGDSLMMMRYIRMLKFIKHPDMICVHCDMSLIRIFSLMPEVDMVFPQIEDSTFSFFDCYCYMMSLPYLFKTTLKTIPQEVPYIFVPNEMKTKWNTLTSTLSGVKVGVAWAGNSALEADARRSIPLAMFEPLFKVSGVHYFSLQKGEASEQLKQLGWDVVDVMGECEDYLDTASLISNLDLVISVDTSVVHLAGAIGKQVWLLNRYESEWRWMLERSDSPWYPTVRIFRQIKLYDWTQTLNMVTGELYRYC